MSVFAVSLIKDEADIVRATVSRMIAQVDHVMVADNGSTDGTREILDDLSCTVIDDPEVGYYQARKMTELALLAHDAGAEWVVPFDADEVWLARDGRRLAEVLPELEQPVAAAEMFNHYASGRDEAGRDPIERMGWRTRDALSLPKVAARPVLKVSIAQGNHTAHYPYGVAEGLLEIRHFPYRSPEQFVSKARNGAAAYAATTLDRDVGLHWREYGELVEYEGEQAGHAWFREHFFYEEPEAAGLVHDPAP